MKAKILTIFVTLILLTSVVSTIGIAVKIKESSDNEIITSEVPIEFSKEILYEGDWVDEIQAEVEDIVRFKITLTYHDTDGPGISELIRNITITDTLPLGLDYLGNALPPETEIVGQNVIWDFGTFELFDDQSLTVVFDAYVSGSGELENLATVEALEKCVTVWHYVDDTATVNVDSTEEYTLAVDVDGNGSVDKNPDKVSYLSGESVVLTATADEGFVFDHWSGDLSGSDNPETIVMDSDKTVTAHFMEDGEEFTLTVNVEGNGSVSKSPDKLLYQDGESVDLTAVADEDFVFDHWSGDLSGSDNPATIVMDSDKTVTAHFIENGEEFTLNVDVDGNGSVDKNPDKVSYLSGESVVLTATADEGFVFDHWSGDLTGSDNPVTITMNSNKTVTAHFVPEGDDEPPIVTITKPKERRLYIFNIPLKRKLITKIIGPITIKANVEPPNSDETSLEGYSIEKVEFFINDELKSTDTEAPYRWTWLKRDDRSQKIFTIKVVATDSNGNSGSDEIEVIRDRWHPFRDTPILSTLGLLWLLNKLQEDDSNGNGSDGDDDDDDDDEKTPNAVIYGGPYSGKVNVEILFDGSRSTDPNGDELKFKWDFGDGNFGEGKSPEHAYKEPGTYTVTLTVEDNTGLSSSDTVKVTITDDVDETDKDEDEDDELDLFLLIVTGLAIILLATIGVIAVGRKIYV
jgi:uncharacterized repeat protein (TIGR02543 family)